LPLSATAFGNAAAGVATANAISSDTNAAGGVVTKFELRDKSGVAVILGSVGTSGQDINLSSTTIGVGDTVTVSSLTYTAMP
jgi:dTDP-4-amino-4,6-dideoxygalactose transaminase